MAGWIKMPLGTEVGLGSGSFVLDRDPAPSLQKRGGAPNFGPCLLWSNGCLDQDGTWHEGGLRSRPHYARWGPRSSPKRGQSPPIFDPFLLLTNGWMDQDATWSGGRPQPRGHCVRWRPSSPSQKGAKPPKFRSMFIAAKRLDGSRCNLARR